MQLRLVRASPKNSEFRNTQDESFAVYRKYEMSVHTKSHKDEPVTFDQYLRFLVSSPFEVCFISAYLIKNFIRYYTFCIIFEY